MLIFNKIEIESQVNELFSKTKVIQEFKNFSEEPVELEIYLYKKLDFFLSNFYAKIGNNEFIKSIVLEREKIEEKYSDSISSGNMAIYIIDDPFDKNRIIIHLGNIPSNEEVMLVSEYIQYTEVSKLYEFELFRYLPIFQFGDSSCQFKSLKGKVLIKTKNQIIKIEKNILNDNIKIIEEKYLNKEKNYYYISYEILENSKYDIFIQNIDYIPSSRIYFEVKLDKPIIYTQKSIFDKNIQNYIIHYRHSTKAKSDNYESSPSLFIFLFDQSGSIEESSTKIIYESIELLLKLLPKNSLY